MGHEDGARWCGVLAGHLGLWLWPVVPLPGRNGALEMGTQAQGEAVFRIAIGVAAPGARQVQFWGWGTDWLLMPTRRGTLVWGARRPLGVMAVAGGSAVGQEWGFRDGNAGSGRSGFQDCHRCRCDGRPSGPVLGMGYRLAFDANKMGHEDGACWCGVLAGHLGLWLWPVVPLSGRNGALEMGTQAQGEAVFRIAIGAAATGARQVQFWGWGTDWLLMPTRWGTKTGRAGVGCSPATWGCGCGRWFRCRAGMGL